MSTILQRILDEKVNEVAQLKKESIPENHRKEKRKRKGTGGNCRQRRHAGSPRLHP